MKMTPAFFLVLLLNCHQLFAQTREKELDIYFSALAQNNQFSGNVLIAQQGKNIFSKSFGYADFTDKKLNAYNTAFPIASISKTLTATAILQLSQSGLVKIDDPVINYLPTFPYPAITLKHLLSHTSGLPPYNAWFDSIKKQQPGKVFANADFLGGLAANKKPLLYQPGEKGNYDNINFIVLALIIEKVAGVPYPDYIQKNILTPAGMTSTFFYPLNLQYTQRSNKRVAYPHLFPHYYSDSIIKANTVPYIVEYWSAYGFSGFGDYVSTTGDLLRYDQAYYAGKLLNVATAGEAFKPVLLLGGKHNPGNFGLGWEIGTDTTLGKIIYHSGAATGLSCTLLRNISRGQTVILFNNIGYNAEAIANNALKILNGIKVPSPKKSIAKIYARVLLRKGTAAARDTLNILKSDTLHYNLSEDEMNTLGYDFMGGSNNQNPFHIPEEHKYREALETFQLNMELFPSSWNVYDSYGEILLKVGRKEEAIKMYRKSIELNPGNDGGRKVLSELFAQ
jgi:CubicO group peptidase (beta-lactamase class C family)